MRLDLSSANSKRYKMALMNSRPLNLRFLIKNSKTFNFLSGPSYKCICPVVNYSQNELEPSQFKLNKAMESYLEKSRKYDKFLKEQIEEYDLGKKFLAGMMGRKDKNMSQFEIDRAVEFLFPSCLFNKHGRPKFKRPEEVFEKKKPAAFDSTGRPFHFLYYTIKPNYSQLLHNAAKKLEKLHLYEQKLKQAGGVNSATKLSLAGEEWLNYKELEKKLLEKLHTVEYEKFIEIFTRLAEHPCSYMAKDFIKKYRKKIGSEKTKQIPVALPDKNGIMRVMINSSRKTARATIHVMYPGSGKIEINGTGLDYFLNKFAREQVLFPLFFTDMENRVDVKAFVKHGGEMSQAGAVRYGIAQGLKSFVSADVIGKMKLAGLLQKDFRTSERKKVGRRGARRGYTWLKR